MTELNYKRYDSIKNVLPEHTRQYMRDQSLWWVMEKVHGANYQFVTNGVDIQACTRNRLLDDPEESFFDHKVVFERYRESVLNAYKFYVSNEYLKKGESLRIFGELAGRYSEGRVQDNADYGDLDFYAFDVYFPYRKAVMKEIWFLNQWFKMVPLIGKYTFSEAIKINNKFDTLIDGSCTCEGLIIRNENNNTTFKFKNDLFREVGKIGKLEKAINQEVPQYMAYITDNRLRAVISKEGAFDKTRFSEYTKMIIEDIKKDMIEDGLEPDFDKAVGKYISMAIVDTYIKK